MSNIILVSIKPKYVKEILKGKKIIELRKCSPRIGGQNDLLIIYSTSPEKAIVGVCKIKDVIVDSPENLWNNYSKSLGIKKTEYFEYYKNNSKAIGIEIKDVKELQNKLSLEFIKTKIPKFSPPQTYRYFPIKMIRDLFKNEITFKNNLLSSNVSRT